MPNLCPLELGFLQFLRPSHIVVWLYVNLDMAKRIVPLLLFLSFINAQIALPTFQGAQNNTSLSSTALTETLNFNGTTGYLGVHTFTENGIGWTLTNAGIYGVYAPASLALDGNYVLNWNSRVGGIERTDGNEFTFVSLTMQGDSRSGSTTDIQFKAYKNGSLVQDETRNISNSNWVVQTFNWSDIDKFTWDPTNPSSSNVALDNMEYIP